MAGNSAPSKNVRVGSFQIEEEIGRGSFAVVYRGVKLVEPPQAVAIKVVTRHKLTARLLENLESEIKLLKSIKHRNIVALLECLKTEGHIYLIMAYCSAGDLSQYIKKRGQIQALGSSVKPLYPHPKEGGLHEVVGRSFLGQLSNALKFLRSQNIMHRDIKPQNLLLSPYEEVDISESAYSSLIPGVPVLQVADFGFARFLPQATMAETLCGSPLYMAPEILRYEKYNAKADLWSCGAVLFEICSGRPPFRAQNHIELLRRIDEGEDRIKFPEDKPETKRVDSRTGRTTISPAFKATPVPPDLKELICKLLKRNPVERMGFDDFFADAEVAARSGAAKGLLPQLAPSTSQSPSSSRLSLKDSRTVAHNSEEGAFIRAAPRRPSDGAPAPPLPPPERPSPTLRKSSFAPKYIVGSTPPALGDATVEVKSRDYAHSRPIRPSLSRPPSFDNDGLLHTKKTDIATGSDGDSYVVIDKGPVEVNALADELAAQRSRPNVVSRRSSRGFLSKPLGGSPGSPSRISSSSSSSPTPYPPLSATPSHDLGGPPPFALAGTKTYGTSPRRISYPSALAAVTRPGGYSSSPLSGLVGPPSTAISKVINMASLKLFGNPTDGILLRRPSAKARKSAPRHSDAIDPAELQLVQELEDWGQKAMVVFDFADTKLLRIVTAPPSPQSGSPSSAPFGSRSKPSSPSALSPAPHLSIDEAQLASESLLLYIKALAFLIHGINCAKAFWEAKVASNGAREQPGTSAELNEAVQWLRERFNECHDKAKFVEARIGEGQELQTSVSADKLIYDRALEMSRAAAVSELTGETTADCETAYETALYMLYAILDESLPDSEPIKEEDKVTVNKFISRIQGRLTALRKRLITTPSSITAPR